MWLNPVTAQYPAGLRTFASELPAARVCQRLSSDTGHSADDLVAVNSRVFRATVGGLGLGARLGAVAGRFRFSGCDTATVLQFLIPSTGEWANASR